MRRQFSWGRFWKCQGSQPQPYRRTASCHEPRSSVSSSVSDEEDADESGPGAQTHQVVTLQWSRPSCPQSSVTHTYTEGPRGKKDNEASYINDGSSLLSVFPLYFAEITLLGGGDLPLLPWLHRLDDGPSPEPNVTEAKMFVFLALTIQMGHGVRDKLTDCWATADQLYTPFYGTVMKRDQCLHILHCLHFTDNRNKHDRKEENFDRLWKIRDQFEIQTATFSKFYNPSEYLAIDKDIFFSFKGRVILKEYIPKERKRFSIKFFKLWLDWIHVWYESILGEG